MLPDRRRGPNNNGVFSIRRVERHYSVTLVTLVAQRHA